MSYFRKPPALLSMMDSLKREQKWLITINADPDAMGAAMALRRILRTRCQTADIARINEISRPDNLAMIRYTRLHMRMLTPELAAQYTHFAMVDSQPSHNQEFGGIKYSIIIDHHPAVTEPDPETFMEILPDYGATCTILTEYLYNLGMRPGHALATAMQFGIKTDTMNFQRHTGLVDVRAYQYLGKFADQSMLSRIIRSEFHLDWLPFFAKATTNMHKAGNGHYVYVGKVESPDILVVIADFFTRVYEIRWVVVSGYCDSKAILIFRGDGVSGDMGRIANLKFNELGSGGGHKTMARAEFEISKAEGQDLELFIYKRLLAPMPRRRTPKPEQAEAAPENKPDAKGESKQDGKQENKPATQTADKDEPAAKTDSKSEAKTAAAKTPAKQDTQIADKTETKAAPKNAPDSKNDPESASKKQPAPSAKPNAEPETKTGTKPNAKPDDKTSAPKGK